MQTAQRHMKRVATAIIGGVVLVIGMIAIPYPGPGWLIVFAGLAILATEFSWAQRVLEYAKQKYDAWTAWLKRQHVAVRIAVLGFTGTVVVTTMWLLNVFGMVDGLLGLNMPWAHSPLGVFN